MAARALLHIRRPVDPGTYKDMTMCFLQNLKQKGWTLENQMFLASVGEILEKEEVPNVSEK